MLLDHALLGIKMLGRNDKNELAEAVRFRFSCFEQRWQLAVENIRRPARLAKTKSRSLLRLRKLASFPSLNAVLMDVLLVKPDQMSVGRRPPSPPPKQQPARIYAIAWWRKLFASFGSLLLGARHDFAFSPQTTRHGNMELKTASSASVSDCCSTLRGRFFRFTSQLSGIRRFSLAAHCLP